MPKKISNTTLVCVDCYYHGAAITAIKNSLMQISVDKVLFFTDIKFDIEGVEVIQIPKISSKDEYSYFLIKELYKYITTDFVITIQHDGWIICGEAWTNEFYNFDYIGAKWLYIDHRNVGNGAVSFRSKKLIDAVGKDDFIEITPPEDEILGRLYRKYLEQKYDIKFATEQIADKFSFELNEPTQEVFGFHGNFWPPYRKTIVIKRMAACGDTIMCEPILHHFFLKGYRVVLDTLPQFYSFFQNHYFPVEYYGSFNKEVKHEVINLDMSYESDPQKLHLKAYYEFAQVPEEEQVIRNPKLNVVVNKDNTLFPKKYVVLHLDKRGQPGRNQYGVDWEAVVKHLNELGYLVIQIGRGESEETGAIKMNTLAEPMMAYLLAGCEFMIAIDSGPANVAVSLGKKLIVFHGSVNPEYIWPDMSNIKVIANHTSENTVCGKPYCWHSVVGCEGVPCYLPTPIPPCALYSTEQVIDAINELI